MNATAVDVGGLPGPVIRQIERLVETLREQFASSGRSEIDSRPRLTQEEFEAKPREMASGPPDATLSPDFSRAGIYNDHD